MRAGNGQCDSARAQRRTNDCRYAFTVTGLHARRLFPGFYTMRLAGGLARPGTRAEHNRCSIVQNYVE